MPVRAVVCKPQSLILKRGALATDAGGCSLPGRAPASRVRDPLGVMVRTRGGYIGAVTRTGVRFRGLGG